MRTLVSHEVIVCGYCACHIPLLTLPCVTLCAVPPFAEASPRCQIFGAVKTHGLLVLLNHWGLTEAVSPEALQVVVAMLTVDPAARPSMAAVRASKWLAAPPGK